MDISIEVDVSAALAQIDKIDESVRAADNQAARDAGEIALRAVRQNMSYPGRPGHPAPEGHLGTRAGRLLGQVQMKVFRSRGTGLTGVAVKVIGDRWHVMGFNEFGTKSHGGRRRKNVSQTRNRKIKPGQRGDRGPLPARHVFSVTYQKLGQLLVKAYTDSFERNFEKAMPVQSVAS
jgi:hypothetical protein